MKEVEDRARESLENLLFKCAGGMSGESFLIVHENRDEGFYGP